MRNRGESTGKGHGIGSGNSDSLVVCRVRVLEVYGD